MSIRIAQPDDCEEIRSLIMQAVEPHQHEDFDEQGWSTFCKPNELTTIQGRIRNPDYLTLCYESNGVLQGVITIYKAEKLDQLFILPSARRKGIATKLWGAAKKICEANGVQPRYWVKSSTMAVPLYESFGFRITGSRQQQNGISFYPMELIQKAPSARE